MSGSRAGSGGGIAAPLRRPVFRALWSANLLSNAGWLIQGVGAAWLMTQLSGDADMVALVQTSLQAPIFMIALLAGVAADLFDRRHVLLVAQIWMLANALLAVLTSAGMMEPVTLLVFTFLLGMGNALQGPAYQTSVRELVPRDELPAAVTLNAVAFNLARTVGPAVGGLIVAVSGSQSAFWINAATYAGMIIVLIRWRREVPQPSLPREKIPSAMVTGIRYVGEMPPIRRAIVRASVFAFAASATLALLPLVARDVLQGGASTFGILLGAFGAGAMGGAFLVHPVRTRFGSERLVTLLAVLFALSLAILAAAPSRFFVGLGLAMGGMAWLGCFSSFNIAVQTSSASWVQARVFAIYQTAMFGAMALGSWLWGVVAEASSLQTSLWIAATIMAASALLHFSTPLADGPAPDFRPSRRRSMPKLAFPFDEEEGPVLVLVEYDVADEDTTSFLAAMDEVGHLRKRNGATTWRLFEDVSDAERWIEAFTVGSWLDYRRQAERQTAHDEAIETDARRFHRGDAPPTSRHMVARKFE